MPDRDKLDLDAVEISQGLSDRLSSLAQDIRQEILDLQDRPALLRANSDRLLRDGHSLDLVVEALDAIAGGTMPKTVKIHVASYNDIERGLKFMGIEHGSVFVEFRWDSFKGKYRFTKATRGGRR